MLNVLMIEDDQTYTDYIKSIIPKTWSLQTTPLLGTGLQIIEANCPDAVILDLHLPDTENLNVTVEQFFEANPATAVVVLSANDHPDTMTMALEAGVQDYLVKKEITTAWLERAVFKAVFQRYLTIRRRYLMQMLAQELADVWKSHWQHVTTVRKALHLLDEGGTALSNKIGEIHDLISPVSLADELKALEKIVGKGK